MFILNQHHSIANQFLVELRDTKIQSDRFRFRYNLERLGQILAYELSKELSYQAVNVNTPLAEIKEYIPSQQPVVIAILRAALPFYQGFLNYFDQADSGFIGAYREENTGSEIEIKLGYTATPSIENREVILIDPMLATGKSIITGFHQLIKKGSPKKVHIVAAIAAPEGIKYVQEHINTPHSFWLGALDEKLNHLSYIVPGLGDAGDLSFGPKQ